jgi:putative endopeptidase
MKYYLSKKMLFVLPVLMGFAEIQGQSTPIKAPGIDVSLMDKTVRPQDDFFQFVNGDWLKKTEIPSDRTRWGSFDELRQNTDKDALLILKEATKNPAYTSNTDQGKAVGLYETIMDTVTRNKQGVSPLKPYLAKINSVKNVKDLQALLIEMEPLGGLGFFGVGIGADPKNSNRNVVNIGLAGVGLPDRDYYVSEDADSKEKREKYVTHVARMLQFLGQKPAQSKTDAAKILALETEMSVPRLDRVERRDDRKTYNPMRVADLQKLTPSINWNTYLNGVGLTNIDSVIVSQPNTWLH